MRLAETETPLPPILVHRRTMRVVDGMHRLMAASMLGRETIDARFVDGGEAEMFLRAVQENVRHGLPLSQADRRAAAERILASHPHLSDRAIGQSAGLSAKTIASIRKRSGVDVPESNLRMGRDGKIRPLDSAEGRRLAAKLLADQPEASLRDVARSAGISPATVLDVRKRLDRGEPPVPGKPRTRESVFPAPGNAAGTRTADSNASSPSDPSLSSPSHSRSSSSRPVSRLRATPDPAVVVQKLLRDPSLRCNEQGKGMLRLLQINAVGAEQLPDVAAAVPPHCVAIVVQLAHQYAKMWQDFARELDGRAQIIDPSAAVR